MPTPSSPNSISSTNIRDEYFDYYSTVGLGERRTNTIYKGGSNPSFNNITALPGGQISYGDLRGTWSTYNVEFLIVGGGAGGGGASANGGGGGGGAGRIRYVGPVLVVNGFNYGIIVGGGGGGSGSGSAGGAGGDSYIQYYYGDNTNAQLPGGAWSRIDYVARLGAGGGATSAGVENGVTSFCAPLIFADRQYNCEAGSGGGGGANANRVGSRGGGTFIGGNGFSDLTVRGSGGGGGGAGGNGGNSPSRSNGGTGGAGVDINYFFGGDLSADDTQDVSRYRFVGGGGQGGSSNGTTSSRYGSSSGAGSGLYFNQVTNGLTCFRTNTAKNQFNNFYICGFDFDVFPNACASSGAGGGGGAGSNNGGNGGSGMVAVRYLNTSQHPDPVNNPIYRASGGNYVFSRNVNGTPYCIHIFTSVGNLTFTG